jgi:hypothetical protein
MSISTTVVARRNSQSTSTSSLISFPQTFEKIGTGSQQKMNNGSGYSHAKSVVPEKKPSASKMHGAIIRKILNDLKLT